MTKVIKLKRCSGSLNGENSHRKFVRIDSVLRSNVIELAESLCHTSTAKYHLTFKIANHSVREGV